MRVAVIGGGAAGFFSAIHAKENHPQANVYILEKTSKVLAKVKISGGGRCNVTNACTSIKELVGAYPRGGKFLKPLFTKFSTTNTRDWFESRGVPLMVQEDQCIFPVSQDSQSIIDCLFGEVKRLGIEIKYKSPVKQIKKKDDEFYLSIPKEDEPIIFDKVIVATGGSPKLSGLEWLSDLGHKIEHPVPSLFTFNMPQESITTLMGVVVNPARVSIQGTKLTSDGPLLITHWGMSGPAILKMSSIGARIMADLNYTCIAQVNWVNTKNNELVADNIKGIMAKHPKKQLSNIRPYELPNRLWVYLIERANLTQEKPWGELGKKGVHAITRVLCNDEYEVNGKTTFKEEFVTCGGVSLSSINPKTMESTVVPGLYFSGEVMDIDGITGGYNFQAAWTTAYFAGKLG
jgi:predicted Rossmann fold flavoprotein